MLEVLTQAKAVQERLLEEGHSAGPGRVSGTPHSTDVQDSSGDNTSWPTCVYRGIHSLHIAFTYTNTI